MSFYPETIYVHAGDTVHWAINSPEIHTVTFLGGNPVPELLVPVPNGAQGAMMINPLAAFPIVPSNGHYDGSYINSGLMSSDPGQITSFDLVFDQPGTYSYICIVHGQMMSGKVVVVDGRQSIPSPAVTNPDGSKTYTVMIGYSQGQIDFMSFFPQKLNVRPGDTVHWELGKNNMAPHTVTFLNGNPEPDLVVVQPQPSGPPFLLINPAVAVPSNVGQPLTHQGIFNSGIMDPTAPGPHSFDWKIGDIQMRSFRPVSPSSPRIA
jgi:plastocyanin